MQFDLLIKCLTDHNLWDEVSFGFFSLLAIAALLGLTIWLNQRMQAKRSEGYRLKLFQWIQRDEKDADSDVAGRCTPSWVWLLCGIAAGAGIVLAVVW